ncbi:hypothetical protein D3C87_1334010 [compost metagenome]
MIVTRCPRASNNAPKLAAVSPFPMEETTPPVTKINFCFRAFVVDLAVDTLTDFAVVVFFVVAFAVVAVLLFAIISPDLRVFRAWPNLREYPPLN